MTFTFDLPEPVLESGEDESDYETLHKEQLKRFRKEYAKPVRFRCVSDVPVRCVLEVLVLCVPVVTGVK